MTSLSLGTLDWQPASDHPELLAAPVAAAVAGLGLSCLVAPIDPTLADTAEFCAAYDVPMAVSANCVVVEGRRADTSTMAACLVLARDRADVNKTVRRHLDVRKISFARMDLAVSSTQMEYGGITPIGLPPDWPILVDTAVAAGEWLVIGSGVRRSKIAIAGTELAALPGATVMTVAQASG